MTVSQTSQFKKDVERQQKRGKELSKLKGLIEILLSGKQLPPVSKHRAMVGKWGGHLDSHIEPDWLLIYQFKEDELRLERTGTHADLF